MKINKVFRSTSVNRDKLVDIETGEAIEGHSSIRVYDVEATDLRTIDYSGFVTVCSEKIVYMSRVLSDADLGKVLIMAEMCMTSWNILYNDNNKPHTTSSLASHFGMKHVNSLYPILDRLTSANILATRIVMLDGKRSRIFYMNPYIAKRRKTIHYKLLEMFDMGDDSNMGGKAEDEYLGLEFNDLEIIID